MKKLSTVQSVCPKCGKPIKAYYVEEKGEAHFISECPEHGLIETLAAERVKDFTRWTEKKVINIPMKEAMTEGKEGECPLHCGLCDKHLQTACCVILDITQRCNQHCPCCFADAGKTTEGDPSKEEIERWYDRLIELGEERPFNIQLSGGEPTVRDDLPELIRMGREKGFSYIQINTNGRRLALEEGYAQKLKEAGASVIFMQFDGTKDDIYMELRGEALFEVKKLAIENCREAGLPVTLVPTLVKHLNMDNIGNMIRFMFRYIGVVKGIHFQPVSFIGRHHYDETHRKEERVTMFAVMHEIVKQTNGVFRYEDFCPISTGHPLCCFSGSYLLLKDGSVKSLLGSSEKRSGVSCCGDQDPLSIIKKDRDFVLNNWIAEEPEKEKSSCCCSGEKKENEIPDFDQMIAYMRRNTFTLSGMAFQDETNLDAERLKRCRVQVYSPDERLVPFCAYQWHRR